MNPEINELLEDILRHGKMIRDFAVDHDFESYCRDVKTRLAVERSFEIIGEALNRIKRIDPDVLEGIRDYRSIISFRNILAHGYDHIEDRIVWGIIQTNLKTLIDDIRKLIE